MDYLQLGQSTTTEFEKINFDKDFSGAYDIWPTQDDPNFYNIAQFYFELSSEKIMIERETYSALEWLGDVGGLVDGLRLIANIIIGPIASLAIKS